MGEDGTLGIKQEDSRPRCDCRWRYRASQHWAICDRRPRAYSRCATSATPDRPSLRGLELYRVCDPSRAVSSTPHCPETPRGSSERGTCATFFVDTMGLIAPGIGFQLTLRIIKLLDPRHLVTSEHHAELETLIMVARRRPGLEILFAGTSKRS